MPLRRLAASFFLFLNSTLGAVSAEAPTRYLLGPQDQLKIRVYDLRRNTGEAYSWAALNGDFIVAADGMVSLPLIGSIKAAGGTPLDLAEAIGYSLKAAADLAEKPAASVEVATYRPFYIIGAVQQPGKYEYQPGLTVLQAVSTAHGLMRSEDTRGVQRDAVTSRGETRTLAAERIALKAKQARLQSEISGADAVAFTEDLRTSADKARADQAMWAEQLLFETRRNAIRSEIATIERSISSFKSEIGTLDTKSKTLDRQLELSRSELSLVNDLVSRGLTISSRKLAVEQSQASFENNRLDVQVAVLRAQQSLTRAERDIIDISARFRKDALSDLAEVNMKLAQNNEKMRTFEHLAANAESQLLGTSDDESDLLIPRYEITRKDGQNPRTQLASEDVAVEPGDVVRVTFIRNPSGKASVRPQASAPIHGPTGNETSGDSPGSVHSLPRPTDKVKR